MTSDQLFYIIIGIIVLNFLKDKYLSWINARHYNDKPPAEVSDVFDEEEYNRSQQYKFTNYKFGLWSSVFSLVLTLGFLAFDGFELVDSVARSAADNPIAIALVFFGIIMLASDLINTPFSYYRTFVIEERFGFNKTTKRTFWLDKVKSLVMSAVLGGSLFALIFWIYQQTSDYFWLLAWAIVGIFTIVMNMFYSRLIVPLFNKQTPLKKGELSQKISAYAESVGFNLNKIFVIDGSKRSTKANAYFSGFGREKRVTLYDTLINDLNDDEIVAVLAHEVGHYKRKHILYHLIGSLLITGITLYIFSVFISNPLLSNAIGVEQHSFHAGLIAFGLLYAPLSELTGLLMNYLSRKFEFEADNYARTTHDANALISSLKKLSKRSLSNLTPHRWYVWFHYSHPTLYDRILNLRR